MISVYNPVTWVAVSLFLLISYIPLLVFWFYTFYREVAAGVDGELEWFHSTQRGLWRIPAAVFLVWFVLFGAKGVAQLFAWQTALADDGLWDESETWRYPAAMMLFLISTAIDCFWMGAFFRVYKRFSTSTLLLALQALVSILLAVLYFTLSITAGSIFIVYIVFVIAPIAFISYSAYRAHASSPHLNRGPGPKLAQTRDHDGAEGRLISQSPPLSRESRARSAPAPKPKPFSGKPKPARRKQQGSGVYMERGRQLAMLDVVSVN